MRMLRAGVSGYLIKNRTAEELIKALTKLLRGEKYVSDSLAEKLTLSLEKPGKVPHESLFDREEVREFFFGFVNARIQPCDCLTFAACRPSARRVFFGKCFSVCFRFAALAAFFIFFRAAVRCFRLIIEPPCT